MAKASSDAEKDTLPKVRTKKVQRAIGTRLIALEYLRNGLDLKKAYESVTHKKYTAARFSAILTDDNSFLDEINVALTTADLEKNKIVGMLWAMASISPLDYMDDNGITLSVKDLKAMPRQMQAMLEAVDVTNKQEPVKDENGKVLTDENGKPYLQTTQTVHVRIVKAKKEALATLAAIAKLVGPSLINQTNVTVFNVAQSIAEADNRRLAHLEQRMSGNVIDVNPDGSTNT